MITVSQLRRADIIVSTTSAAGSAVIRIGTGSSVSHSLIYVGNSQVIEAVESGVRRQSIEASLERASLAIALRRRHLTQQQREDVVKYATEFLYRPYDWTGATGSATSLGRGSLLAAFGCGISLGLCTPGIIAMGENTRPTNADRAFFCSELVARVFELAGAPIVAGSPSYATPRHIHMANTLWYIGKLVDTSSPAAPTVGPVQGAHGTAGY